MRYIFLLVILAIGALFGVAAHDMWPMWSRYGLTSGWHLVVMLILAFAYLAVVCLMIADIIIARK